MKTFLSTGQSNTLWYGDGGHWPQTWDNVTVWNCENNRSDLVNTGTAFVSPVYGKKPFRENLLDGTLLNANNASVHACQTIANVLGEPVRLILVAKDGAPIQDWCDGEARRAIYQRLQTILSAAGVLSLDGLFWHQGEANEADYQSYASKFGTMLDFMQQDGFLSSSEPVVIGTPTYHRPNIGNTLRSIGKSGGRFALADLSHLQLKPAIITWNGLSTLYANIDAVDEPFDIRLLSDDALHYSGASAALAGRIMASSYLSVI